MIYAICGLGAVMRVRPKAMTGAEIIAGLIPIMSPATKSLVVPCWKVAA